MKRTFLGIAILFVAYISAQAQTTVKGNVKEKLEGSNLNLPFANVFVEGTIIGSTTDLDGNYQIIIPDQGTYTLTFSFLGYEKQSRQIEANGGVKTIDVVLVQDGQQLKEVKVSGRANRESETMLLLDQKKANISVEAIGAKRLSNLGISDAAAATEKISGVAKSEGSGDVYVRGLGDRYLSTTMNGLPIPSDDVEKKNIDLNLFSSEVIKNVGIGKTYNVATYGDQTSGQVDINSKTFGSGVAKSIGLSGGMNSNVMGVFGDFKSTYNMKDQTMGFYSRSFETVDAIQQQSWNTLDKKMPLDYGMSVLGGNEYKGDDSEFTFLLTLSHSAKSEYKEGVYQKFRSNVLNNSYSDVEEFEQEYNTTGLLNLSYSKANKHFITYNGLWITKTIDELYEQGRNSEGYFYDQNTAEHGSFIRDQNLKQTNIFINQLLGEHKSSRNTFRWAAAYNRVGANEPNRIRNEVFMPAEGNDLTEVKFGYVGDYQQRKSRQDLVDNEFNGYLKDEFHFVDEDSKKLKLNLGANARYKTRDFESQFVGVKVANSVGTESIDNLDAIFLNQDLYDSGELRITEGKPDTYNGTLRVTAGYGSFDFQKGAISGNVGARYEMSQMNVDWDVTNRPGRTGSVTNNYNFLLPSLNLKYTVNPKNLLRLGVSKTITLPEFKELAPFNYVSQNGRVTGGNEDLLNSVNYNFDMKWELYPRIGELLSVAAFYKQINDPINLAQTRGSSGYFYFANTGDIANVYGLELEGRFDIIKGSSSPGLNLSFNVTKMWFTQDLLKDFQYNNKTETGLQGASDLILNGALTYSSHKPNEFLVTLSANYSSDKIFALGAPEDFANSDVLFNNEIIEQGFITLDANIKKKFSKRISGKVYAKNLLNPKIKQTQIIEPIGGVPRDEVVLSYQKGVQIGAGITINLN